MRKEKKSYISPIVEYSNTPTAPLPSLSIYYLGFLFMVGGALLVYDGVKGTPDTFQPVKLIQYLVALR
jgi:hypothetical protein